MPPKSESTETMATRLGTAVSRETGRSTRKLPKSTQTTRSIIGHDALDMHDSFDWGGSPGDKNKIEEVLKKFKSRLVPETNETFELFQGTGRIDQHVHHSGQVAGGHVQFWRVA